MIGNQTIEQIERRLGIDFPDDIRVFMKDNKQEEADNVKPGKWHCFDFPFCMVCGDRETAQKIYDSMKDRASEVKEPLRIAISS